MTWGEIITALRNIRESRGLSLRDVATEAHTGPSLIFYWERGDKVPSLVNVIAWAGALGYSVRIQPETATRNPEGV